nr:hypothetical protein [Lachnospiraceae bacterium]
DKGRWDTYEFLGFSETPGGALIDTDTYVLNKDVTLYGVYKEPLAGKISASTDPKDYEIPEDEQGGEEPSEEEEKKEPHTKHTYADIFAADVPATFTSHGSQSRHCTGCDLKKDVKVIPRVQEPDLNEDHFTYDGKIHKPGLKVIDVNNTVLKEGTDYTLTYDKDCTLIGRHHVKLTLKGLYSGSRDYTYTIGPAGTKIKKLRASSTSVTLWWKKAKQDIDGYEIAYAKNALFKGAKIKSAKKKTLKLKIKKLKKFKTCYVRIRTYKKVGGKKICSSWSPIKKVKLKK